ncbi:hypothetical protein HYW42_03860 [Candidatus Daviesbacteria bacterium]|nr:hypothetical protein [Candidatus Daviesbacteria bacterium]
MFDWLSKICQTGSVVLKILIGIGILILVLISGAFLFIKYNQNYPPPKLVANFVDMKKVKEVSKYRSCAGHTVVPQDGREMKRNMKHYVKVYPQYKKENTVELYSPYDGFVSLIRADMGDRLEGELWIAPGETMPPLLPFGVWMFSFEHMQPRKDLKMGSKVKAGELVGYASFLVTERDATFDAVYGKMGLPMKTIDNWNSPFADLDSLFYHMSDTVLAQFEQRGITQEKIIISKEERDENPCVYTGEGPYFTNHDDTANWVELK